MPLLIMPAMVAPLFTPYKAVAGDRRYVNTRQEHRDFLRQHNFIEVGNDPSMAPPPDDPDRDAHRMKEQNEALHALEKSPTFAT